MPDPTSNLKSCASESGILEPPLVLVDSFHVSNGRRFQFCNIVPGALSPTTPMRCNVEGEVDRQLALPSSIPDPDYVLPGPVHKHGPGQIPTCRKLKRNAIYRICGRTIFEGTLLNWRARTDTRQTRGAAFQSEFLAKGPSPPTHLA